MKFLLMMRNAWREELTANLKWEAHGVSLDRAPCGVVEANDTKPRANLGHGITRNDMVWETPNTHRFRNVSDKGGRGSGLTAIQLAFTIFYGVSFKCYSGLVKIFKCSHNPKFI